MAGVRKKTARKRERIAPSGDTRFVRRNAAGRFDESDDVGRSLSRDRPTRAKTVAKSGQGDKGDRPRARKSTVAGGRKTGARAGARRTGTSKK